MRKSASLIDAHVHSNMFRTPLCRRLSRRRALARDRGDGRRDLQLAGPIHLHPEPALLHRHDDDPDAAGRHRRRPRAGRVRRFDHHRPHLARRGDQAGQPGRALSDRARRAARRVQQLRRAPRQPRSDDARHVREYPHPQPHARRRRGRLHPLRADRRDDADLRRGDGLCAGRDPARGPRRQGIWHRQLARLGGQGHHAARRAHGHRRELRAHPPLEPGRNGRASAAVRRKARTRQASASTAARPSASAGSPTSSRARMSRCR